MSLSEKMKKIIALVLVISIFMFIQTGSKQVMAIETDQDSSILEQLSSILLLEGDQVSQLSLGGNHSSALTNSGRVFTWGFNSNGQLGDGTTVSKNVPTDITSRFPLGDKVIQLSMGANYSSALTTAGKVFTWGSNNFGQLGDGTTVSKNVPTDITSGLPSGDIVIQLSMSGDLSSALTQSGRVFLWGQNWFGQLGDGTTTSKNVPTDITSGFPSEDKVIQLSMGYFHSSALTQSGEIFTWGFNSNGQLGDGTTVSKNVPTNITSGFPAGDIVIQLSMGSYYSSALTQSGRVFTWGSNNFGQLGNGTTTSVNVPTDITSGFPSGDIVIQLSMSGNRSSALTQSGRVFTWGYNEFGQLGDGTTVNKHIPTDITSGFPSGDIVIQLSMGGSHSSALTQSGSVFIWGYNGAGQLGDNTTFHKHVPTDLKSISPEVVINMSFVSNGGSAVSDINETEGTSITAPVNPTKSNYNFMGWYSDSGLTIAYTFNTMPANHITLYAKWSAVAYNISYYLNGGANHVSNPATYTIESATITLGNPHKTGYTFNGWYESFDFSGSAVTEISALSTGHQTLYAKYTINQYSISFGSNQGTFVTTILQDYGTAVSAPDNPTKAGYIFNGWYSDFGLTSAYTFTTMQAYHILLHAKWSAVGYSITFNLDGGINHMSNPSTYTIETATMTLGTPHKTGYTFNGWYDNDLFTGSEITEITQGSTGHIELYAKYTINQYTATFKDHDGSIIDTSTVDYLTSAVAPVSPSRIGYTFSGWDSTFDSMTQHIDVIATYTINQYTATFKDHDGSFILMSTVDYLTSAVAPVSPSRTGYTFSGWDVAFDAMTQHIDVIAIYTINQYTATFKDHDGSVILVSTVDYLTSAIAPASPSRTGYTFSGWDVAFDSMTQHIEVTATYTINQYTATFKDHDGSIIDTSTVDYLTSAIAPVSLSRIGYTFSGWDTAINSMTEDILVTATYTINQYTIHFNTHHGSEIDSVTVDYHATITLPENPTRDSFIFNGWCQVLPENMPAQDIILNARWLHETTENNDIESKVTGLLEAIDQALIEGRDAEVIIQVLIKTIEDMDKEESDAISKIVSESLNIKNQGMVYIDISVMVRELGENDVHVNQLTQMISITLNIPVEQQGYKNYQIIRIHDGITEILESIYNEETQTLIFETDRFSTYVIVYDVSSGSGLWWLMLLLVLPIGYLGYRYQDKIKKTFNILKVKLENRITKK